MKKFLYKIFFSLLFFSFAMAWLAQNYIDNRKEQMKYEQTEKSAEEKSFEEKDKTFISTYNPKNYFEITFQNENNNYSAFYAFIKKEWSKLIDIPPPKTFSKVRW